MWKNEDDVEATFVQNDGAAADLDDFERRKDRFLDRIGASVFQVQRQLVAPQRTRRRVEATGHGPVDRISSLENDPLVAEGKRHRIIVPLFRLLLLWLLFLFFRFLLRIGRHFLGVLSFVRAAVGDFSDTVDGALAAASGQRR